MKREASTVVLVTWSRLPPFLDFLLLKLIETIESYSAFSSISITHFDAWANYFNTAMDMHTHTRLWSMMQNMYVSCRMMWSGFFGLKVMWVMGVSRSSHRESSPCVCSLRLHCVYSFCTKENSKICTQQRTHAVTGSVGYYEMWVKQNLKLFLTCWSACTEMRLLVTGWMAIVVGQELYTGTIQWSYKQTEIKILQTPMYQKWFKFYTSINQNSPSSCGGCRCGSHSQCLL